MGVVQGKVQGETFIVMDAYALPVEGTETRVNAQAEAYEYIVAFGEDSKASTHSPHPGLGHEVVPRLPRIAQGNLVHDHADPSSFFIVLRPVVMVRPGTPSVMPDDAFKDRTSGAANLRFPVTC